MRSWRRRLTLGLAGLLVATLGPPLAHLAWFFAGDRDTREAPTPGRLDDASRLEGTAVAEVWPVPERLDDAVAGLREVLARAARRGLPVSIAGARHSMGGQSIVRDGIVVDMRPLRGMDLLEGDVLRVGAGALWSDVLRHVNARGLSVAVMQSNNSFSVGGSLGVNCHGWQARRPPIASSVRSLLILLADGRLVRCSREHEAELFSLVLGGYGLLGIVLEADLQLVPNERYRLERIALLAADLPREFVRRVAAEEVGMAYGRLSVAPDSFLREASLGLFHRLPEGRRAPSDLAFPEAPAVTRAVFRGQAGSAYGKWLRWWLESRWPEFDADRPLARNQLLGEPVTVFENREDATTDVLHEYFVPPEGFAAFVDAARRIVPAHGGDLLNVTVRDVRRDDDSFLRYAERDVLALVMLFQQRRDAAGEASMAAMTRELIGAATSAGGRHYLPYRLHATPAQLRAGYPQFDRFLQLKLRYDPDRRFQNGFYRRYAAAERSAGAP